MTDSTDDHPLSSDPRTTKEILEAMVERIMEGFEALAKALSTVEEALVDTAEAMEAIEGRLSALEAKGKVRLGGGDGLVKPRDPFGRPRSPYDASAKRGK